MDRAVSRLIACLKSADRNAGTRVMAALMRLGPAAVGFLVGEFARARRDPGLRVRIVLALMAFGAEPRWRRAALAALIQARMEEQDPTVIMTIHMARAQLEATPE